ncbi:MAG: hypothetical protein Q4Q06_02865 [Bacteroidota bacterium]|nr:hypothetical protein [Bacteroidota bacterium]
MKKHPLISYLLKITYLSLILCFVVLFSLLVVPKEYISLNTPYYILMFFVVTYISYAFMYYAPKKFNLKFEQAFLITKFIKMLVYILVLVVVIFAHIEKNIKFAICYMVLYLIYQIFDTISMKKLVKQKNMDKK